ncbi:hypothetical protein ACWEPR_01805 [Streptomyces sp. NPDC004290]
MSELGTPVWRENARDIDTADWGYRIYSNAAVGGIHDGAGVTEHDGDMFAC